MQNPQYDGWVNFNHPLFQKDEVVYKRIAVQKAQGLLSETALTELLYAANYTEIIRRVREVAQATNLLHLTHPSSGDLYLLNQPHLDEAAFCIELFNLLYDSKTVAERLAQFFDYVQRQGLTPKWTLPTYFLFLCFPDGSKVRLSPTLIWASGVQIG